MELLAVEGIGEISAGTDLAGVLLDAVELLEGDIVVVTSKIVAKAAGLSTTLSKEELLPAQTDRVVARRGPTVIVRTPHGLTLAAAGIDTSNVEAGHIVPLPPEPDADAARLRAAIRERAGVRVGVVIADTAGRAWRVGQTDIAIGCAGLRPVDSFAGRVDAYGNALHVTAPAVADELASAAELASGKLGGRPFVVVRGAERSWLTEEDGPGAVALVRPEGQDLFGLGAREAVLAASLRTSRRGFLDGDDDWSAVDEVIAASPVTAVRDGRTVTIDAANEPVEAGALRERLLAVAFADDLAVEVVVRT